MKQFSFIIWILLISILPARIPLDTYHGNYHGWYDEKKEQIVYINTKSKKQILVQPLKRELFDKYDEVVTFKMINFDGNIDAVVRSKLNEKSIFLFKEGRFVYHAKLTEQLSQCCTSYKRDKAKKHIIITYTNADSAPLNYLTYKERLVYEFKQGKLVLVQREMTDHDICATYRITTSYGNKSNKALTVRHVTAKEDAGEEIFFEARTDENKTIRICKNSYAKYRYAALMYDNNGTVLTEYTNIQKATLYKEGNSTVMQTDTFKLIEYNEGYTLTEYKKNHNTWVEKNTTLESNDTNGSLEKGLAKDETYIQIVTNPEYLCKPIVHQKRLQRLFCADEKGLTGIEDLRDDTFTLFRVNIPCGGGVASSIIFWGKNRDIIYLDEAEALVEYHLKTGQRRHMIDYESIAPWTKMIFTQKGDRALFKEISEGVTYLYYIDLENLQYKRLAIINAEIKTFTFDKTERYLLYKEENGKSKKIELPKQL